MAKSISSSPNPGEWPRTSEPSGFIDDARCDADLQVRTELPAKCAGVWEVSVQLPGIAECELFVRAGDVDFFGYRQF